MKSIKFLNKLYKKNKKRIFSIQSKILICFIVVTTFAISIITYENYKNSADTINKNAISYMNDSLTHADDQLQMMLKETLSVGLVISSNGTSIINFINTDYDKFTYEWYMQYKDAMHFMNYVIAYKPYIQKASIVSLNGGTVVSTGGFLDNEILNEAWLKNMNSSKSYKILYNRNNRKGITIVQNIFYNQKHVGYLLIDFNSDIIQQTYNIKPFNNSSIFLISSDGLFVYCSNPSINEDNILDTPYKDLFNKAPTNNGNYICNIKGTKYLIITHISDYTGLISIGVIPYNTLLDNVSDIKKEMYKIIAIVLIIFSIISILLTKQITKNIKNLMVAMIKVRDGNFSAKPMINSNDEIGELSNVFTSMMDEIQILMKDIKEKETQKRDLELKTLQAEINPHFLYNTLNIIRYLAAVQNVKNIEEVTCSFIELLRGIVGNTNEKVTFNEELNYVKSYVLIEKYKNPNKLTVNFDIDDSVLECKTLKLILQPIVENAFIHGTASSQNSVVIISAYKISDGIVAFEVTDNGRGLSSEAIDSILNSESTASKNKFNRIGIKNVDKRIKIAFGEDFGIKIFSEINSYTTVRILLPEIY